MFFCYIIKSVKSSEYYIGTTESIIERLNYHNAGKVKSTKDQRPWELVYQEEFKILGDARKRELQIKKWKSRKAIEKLLEHKI